LDEATTEEIKKTLYNDALRQRYQRWFQEDLRFRHQIENFLTRPLAFVQPGNKTNEYGRQQAVEEVQSSAKPAEPEQKKGFFRRLLPF